MQVNVFITREDGEARNKMLVLPIDPKAAIPPEFRLGWVYYATVATSDAMFNQVGVHKLESQVAEKGYAIVKPETSDRR